LDSAIPSWLSQLAFANSQRICAIPSWLSQLAFANSQRIFAIPSWLSQLAFAFLFLESAKDI
jgi:hypothetical protein